jgi:hypothetical protein
MEFEAVFLLGGEDLNYPSYPNELPYSKKRNAISGRVQRIAVRFRSVGLQTP